MIPFNPATGALNPLSPDLEMRVEGTTLVAICTYPNCFESAPDTVQGGMVAAVYDQLLAYATMVAGVTGPTLWLRVAYLKPTPIGEPLRFECQVEPGEGKKFTAKGTCYRGSEKISEAEANANGPVDPSRGSVDAPSVIAGPSVSVVGDSPSVV